MTSAGVSLTGNLGITGDASLTTITAKTSGDRRHFYVGSSRTLTLKWLKLTGGSRSSSSGGSIYVDGTDSTLHATSCVFFLNTAGYGGVVFNDYGSLLIQYLTTAPSVRVLLGPKAPGAAADLLHFRRRNANETDATRVSLAAFLSSCCTTTPKQSRKILVIVCVRAILYDDAYFSTGVAPKNGV